MEQRNIAEEIKYQIKNGKVTVRLIILNVIVFLLINASEFLNSILGFNIHLDSFLAFKTSLEGLFFQPWGLFTSLITHVHLDHLFFNMLFLFFAGGMFEQIFGAKKLVICYVLSGVLGNLFELVVSVLLPDFSPFHIVIGASGSIMGIFAAVAIYRPQTPIYLFGIVPIPIYVLALFFFAKDLLGIGSEDSIAHFAHLGGALMGFIVVQNVHSSSNVLNFVSHLFKPSQKKQKNSSVRFKTDDAYNEAKKKKQDRTDQILDKISKSGYESLTREEKDFLFNQGKQ